MSWIEHSPSTTTRDQSFENRPKDKYVRVGDVNTRYWELGTRGSTVLFLHGIWRFIEDWLLNVLAFSKKHHVFALDIPGHGLTDKPDVSYTLEYYAEFIDNFLNLMKVDRVNLIGNSFGGGLSLQYTSQFPDKVQKLVLVGSSGFGKKIWLMLRMIGLPIIGSQLVRASCKEVVNRKRSVQILESLLYDLNSINPAMKEALIEKSTQLAKIPDIARALLAVLRRYTNLFGVRPRYVDQILHTLPKISVPVLLIWGENDRIIPLSEAHAGKEILPNAQLHIFKKCGHLPQVEYPEEFNTIVLDFLRS